MIVVYPMLTSGSVSPNVLPGVIKAVEKYILVYNTDDILRHASSTAAGRILSTGTKVIASAAATAAAGAIVGSILSKNESTLIEQPPGSFATSKVTPSAKPSTKPPTTKPMTFDFTKGSNVKPSLDIPRGDAVSLEPTWITVTTEKKGLQILGVKVVPFRIKTPETVTQLLMQDSKLKTLNFLSAKYGRAFSRVFVRLMQRLRVPGVSGPVTGDVKKDVIYAETSYKKNMFLCLSQLDLENDDILSDPSGIRKLQQLGWTSLIVADDVNRSATFCMKEYGGVCSIVPYSFMFSSLGKEHSKAYEDLEDLKKAAGPFFNMRTNRRRVFSEGNMSVVDKYLQLIQEKK